MPPNRVCGRDRLRPAVADSDSRVGQRQKNLDAEHWRRVLRYWAGSRAVDRTVTAIDTEAEETSGDYLGPLAQSIQGSSVRSVCLAVSIVVSIDPERSRYRW